MVYGDGCCCYCCWFYGWRRILLFIFHILIEPKKIRRGNIYTYIHVVRSTSHAIPRQWYGSVRWRASLEDPPIAGHPANRTETDRTEERRRHVPPPIKIAVDGRGCGSIRPSIRPRCARVRFRPQTPPPSMRRRPTAERPGSDRPRTAVRRRRPSSEWERWWERSRPRSCR